MRFSSARRADPVLDMTPMIDVVFQLLLFFMVSTQFVTSSGIQVELPRGGADTLVSREDDVNIWVSAEGAVHVQDREVGMRELTAILRAAALFDPETLVVIKADQGVAHGLVVEVMDRARAEGLERLAIATEPDPRRGESGAPRPPIDLDR